MAYTRQRPSYHFTEISKSDYSLSMRTLFIIPLVLMSLVSLPSWGLTEADLVYRDGLFYKKFTDTPFTGEVEGIWNGSIKNGKYEGSWVTYHSNGQLKEKVHYKKNILEGSWVSFHSNGQLQSKGDYKNGELDGSWKYYHDNGQLDMKGNWKNGKQEGYWVSYNRDGTLSEFMNGTFKNGVRISN
jgi:antitoxin component YwqK of YwqJK toxin-antitoxin module